MVYIEYALIELVSDVFLMFQMQFYTYILNIRGSFSKTREGIILAI